MLYRSFLLGICTFASQAYGIQILDARTNVTYLGITNNGIEQFLNIPYGQARRFENPRLHIFTPGSVYDATSPGPTCPQQVKPGAEYGTPATPQSEDCLRLKVARPAGMREGDRLPVMVYIYGGALILGHINDIRTEPEYLVQQSMENGLPILSVALNYRVNIFGFPATAALKRAKSLNLGLKDQRLALEWVQQNIAAFGGDPGRVTLFGQSAGAISTAFQIVAYGGTKALPFNQAIMESGLLQNAVTSSFAQNTYDSIVERAQCNTDGNPQSTTSLECLRALPLETLLNVTLAQSGSYLPVIDDDFLPISLAQSIRRGLFPRIPIIAGWTEDDAKLIAPLGTATEEDTRNVLSLSFPTLTNHTTIATILSLYPSSDFSASADGTLSAEFARLAQIARDILFVCPAFYAGHAMAQKYANATLDDDISAFKEPVPPVYIYVLNQTVLAGYYDKHVHPGLGVVHSSELPYVFGVKNFNGTGDIHPTFDDLRLQVQQSRSWSTFAHFGRPSLAGHETLEWKAAYKGPGGPLDAEVLVIQDSGLAMSALEGPGALAEIALQRLKERCAFILQEEIINQLGL